MHIFERCMFFQFKIQSAFETCYGWLALAALGRMGEWFLADSWRRWCITLPAPSHVPLWLAIMCSHNNHPFSFHMNVCPTEACGHLLRENQRYSSPFYPGLSTDETRQQAPNSRPLYKIHRSKNDERFTPERLKKRGSRITRFVKHLKI